MIKFTAIPRKNKEENFWVLTLIQHHRANSATVSTLGFTSGVEQ